MKVYKTIILSVVLYGCETWFHTLSVIENRVLRRMFGPKKEVVMGGCSKVLNEELHNLHSLPYIARIIISRRMR
jgi:hypothetical protein